MKVGALNLNAPLTVSTDVSIQETLNLLDKEAFDQVPVVDDNGEIKGMVTLGHMMSQIMRNKVKSSDPVSRVIYKQFKEITLDTSLGKLSRMLDTDHFVLVVHGQRQFQADGRENTKKMIFGIATRIDLLNFITQNDLQME